MSLTAFASAGGQGAQIGVPDHRLGGASQREESGGTDITVEDAGRTSSGSGPFVIAS